MIARPRLEHAGPTWRDRHGDAEVRFLGWRAAAPARRDEPAGPAGSPPLAWLRQVHSNRIRRVERPGAAGEGDALATDRAGLGLLVVSADCVPLLLAGGDEIAAVHAGWRGIAARIVPRALAALPTPADRLVAWVGPAIGPCCYEVAHEVADRVAAASTSRAVLPHGTARPHLDLWAAVAAQLTTAGVRDIRTVATCTRCHPEWLASYRRDGPDAGRNRALIWRRPRGGRSGARS